MAYGRLFALVFAGIVLATVAAPARAEEPAGNAAPDFEAMVRTQIERHRAMTEQAAARIQERVDALAATSAFQQAYEAYRSAGGRLTVDQYGLAYLATGGFNGGRIDPDQAYAFATRKPDPYGPERPRRPEADGGRFGYHAPGAAVAGMTRLVLPDGRPLTLPVLPASTPFHDRATAQTYVMTPEGRYFVWVAGSDWVELRRAE
ncbi:MAG: hypothetical protein J0H01_28010 [Rhizobiales bacterium]|nr:hypothetical protein [Hyphomicrobiales bacterium]